MNTTLMRADALVTELSVIIERASALVRSVEHDLDTITKYCKDKLGLAESSMDDARTFIGLAVEILERGETRFTEWEDLFQQFKDCE